MTRRGRPSTVRRASAGKRWPSQRNASSRSESSDGGGAAALCLWGGVAPRKSTGGRCAVARLRPAAEDTALLPPRAAVAGLFVRLGDGGGSLVFEACALGHDTEQARG